MGRVGYLFDDKGEKWPANSLELRRRLFCVHYPGDLATDIIRNLGFIGAELNGTGCCIRVRAQSMSDCALVALSYWLSDNTFANVTIEYLDDDRPSERFLGWEVALNRLLRVHFNRELGRRVVSHHYDLNALARDSELHTVAEYWKAHGGRCRSDEILGLADAAARGRYIHIARDDNGRFIVASLGTGLHIPEPNWASKALGRPVGIVGDSYYFAWVLSTYELAWNSGRPDVSEIDATVSWPSSGTVRRHYERLLLPCIAPDGQKYLVTANGRPASERRLRQAG